MSPRSSLRSFDQIPSTAASAAELKESQSGERRWGLSAASVARAIPLRRFPAVGSVDDLFVELVRQRHAGGVLQLLRRMTPYRLRPRPRATTSTPPEILFGVEVFGVNTPAEGTFSAPFATATASGAVVIVISE